MQEARELNVVTGAFGYTGRYIAHRLLSAGREVRTLTGHPDRPNAFRGRLSVAPFNFENPAELVKSLQGAGTLYNTYWVRFPRRGISFETAIDNTRTLIKAAKEAGIKRVVQISITNPSEDSPLPYFRGRAAVEKAVVDSSLPYAIARPSIIFGGEDILINNLAWLLRRFPVFAVPGSGDYRLQPVSVDDVAEIALDAARAKGNIVVDAVGSEVYTFNELVALLARAVGSKARIIHSTPDLAFFLSRLVGALVRDVVLTRDEVEGLMSNLLVSREVPRGRTRLSEWLRANANDLGTRYGSELDRHYRW